MSKQITLNHITKIEGHAKLVLGIDRGRVTTCNLASVEGSRYFEGMVVGRSYFEAHEITSRICGICSCAHVVTAISAIENAFSFEPTPQTKKLRELMTLGERIRSHATHLYFLALPDYLGYESALAMAKKYRPVLEDALFLMRVGNYIIKVLNARELHPVSATVGGWLKLASQEKIGEILRDLEQAKARAIKTCRLFFSLTYPDFKNNAEYFSLVDKKKYAILDGKFTSQNASFEKSRYREFIREYHEERSTANFVVKSDHRYVVGALPRINNNYKELSRDAKKMLRNSKIKLPSTNPYENNIAQCIEIVHCIDEAVKICRKLEIKPEAVKKMKIKDGVGVGAIEVPRGTLWHEYSVDEKGIITNANIITPTAQNLLSMQEDIRMFVPTILNLNKKRIITEIEKLIRSYDPCFSCSAHFLEVKWV